MQLHSSPQPPLAAGWQPRRRHSAATPDSQKAASQPVCVAGSGTGQKALPCKPRSERSSQSARGTQMQASYIAAYDTVLRFYKKCDVRVTTSPTVYLAMLTSNADPCVDSCAIPIVSSWIKLLKGSSCASRVLAPWRTSLARVLLQNPKKIHRLRDSACECAGDWHMSRTRTAMTTDPIQTGICCLHT